MSGSGIMVCLSLRRVMARLQIANLRSEFRLKPFCDPLSQLHHATIDSVCCAQNTLDRTCSDDDDDVDDETASYTCEPANVANPMCEYGAKKKKTNVLRSYNGLCAVEGPFVND